MPFRNDVLQTEKLTHHITEDDEHWGHEPIVIYLDVVVFSATSKTILHT